MASEFYSDGAYNFDGKPRTSAEMTALYAGWLDSYPIVSLEDPLAEEDWPGWSELTETVGDLVQVVGDDIFVTNPERIQLLRIEELLGDAASYAGAGAFPRFAALASRG